MRWFGWFRSTPEPESVDFDNILFTTVKARKRKLREDEKAEELRRKNILSGPEFKKAVEKLGRYVISDIDSIKIDSDDVGMKSRDFDIFKTEFVRFCNVRGIRVTVDYHDLNVNRESLAKYMEDCKNKDKPKLTTMTTSEYR